MVNFLKTHFGTMLTVLCVQLLFTACSDDEEVILSLIHISEPTRH